MNSFLLFNYKGTCCCCCCCCCCYTINTALILYTNSTMRLLYFAILCAMWAVTSHAAVTSRLPRARTPGPREVSLEVLREDRREKPTRHKRATPANDTFSYTTALSNDNNGYALVHYSGAYSSKIFIVTQKSQNYRVIQSNLWRTTDYGRVYSNDTHKLPANAIVNHFYISLNKDKLILADQKNNRLYRLVSVPIATNSIRSQ